MKFKIKRDVSYPGVNNSIQTQFTTTRPLPTYLIGMVVFDENDFVSESLLLPGAIDLKLWVRPEFKEEGLDVLNMTERIFEQLMDIFRDVDDIALPPKIDMFIIPEYPVWHFLKVI